MAADQRPQRNFFNSPIKERTRIALTNLLNIRLLVGLWNVELYKSRFILLSQHLVLLSFTVVGHSDEGELCLKEDHRFHKLSTVPAVLYNPVELY